MSDKKVITILGGSGTLAIVLIVIFLPRFLSSRDSSSTNEQSQMMVSPPAKAPSGGAVPGGGDRSSRVVDRVPPPSTYVPGPVPADDPPWRVYAETVSDEMAKVQVAISLVVKKEISADYLRAVLKQEFDRGARRRGFRHRDRPDQVVVRAFTSDDAARSPDGEDVGMALGNPPRPVSIYVKEDMLRAQNESPVVRHGLSESQRRAIWEQRAGLRQRAKEEAEVLFPLKYPARPTDAQRDAHYETMERIFESYVVNLAAKHGLTRQQLDDIASEGLQKGWTPPPR